MSSIFGISLGSQQEHNSTIVHSSFPDGQLSVQPMYFVRTAALFIQDEFSITDNYSLTAGARYDRHSEYGGTLNPQLSLVGKPWEKSYFKLLYGHAYKAPTVFELYDEWRGNVALDPERIKTSEIEFSHLLSDKVRLQANYFYSHLDNLITVGPNPDPEQIPVGPSGERQDIFQNVGSTMISGLTLSGDFRLMDNLFLSSNYSVIAGKDGNDVDNVARHKLNFILNYALRDKFDINLRGKYTGRVKAPLTNRYFYPKTAAAVETVGYDYVTEAKPDGYLEGHFMLNLTVSGRNAFGLPPGLELALIVRNLLDTDYLGIGRQSGSGVRPVDRLQRRIQNPGGFIPAYHPQPGREFLVRLSCRF